VLPKLKAVLFDLDDTLLVNDMARFGPAFYVLFAQRFASLIEPQQLIAALSAALQIVWQHDDPAVTNDECFWREFSARVDLPPVLLRQTVDRFYTDDFSELRRLVSRRPAAREVVSRANALNLKAVLATNPMFPATATLQRLDWAGLRAFDFSLITTLENSHACKPQANYFLEILQPLGVHCEEALMVGDDWRLDIAPAMTLGLQTYWINNRGCDRPGLTSPPDLSGTWQEFVTWWRKVDG
jgi:FMN phosphatase YigB (HAD superfamily)